MLQPLSPSTLLLAAMAGACFANHAFALDAACEQVAAAADKKLAAPAFHDHKALTGFFQELMAVDGKLYQRSTFAGKSPEAWTRAAITLADIRSAAANHRRQLVSCTALGNDTVDGVATNVVGFKVKADGATAEGRVWIGKADGLPYREEAPGLKGRTVYRNLKAPL